MKRARKRARVVRRRARILLQNVLPILLVAAAFVGTGCGGSSLPPFDRDAVWDVDTALVAEGPADEAGVPAIPEAPEIEDQDKSYDEDPESDEDPEPASPDDEDAQEDGSEGVGPGSDGEEGEVGEDAETEDFGPGTDSAGSESKEVGEAPEGGYAIQIFATRSMAEAETIQARATARLGHAARILAEDEWKKVRLGPFATRADAEKALARARRAGYDGAWITAWGSEEEDR